MAKKLGERLVEAGLISADAIDKALQQQKITGHRLGDCLVEIGLISEASLLRFLAGEFNTRFVSGEKLAKVKVPTEVLDRVPVRMAEAQSFIPIAFDLDDRILSVVMAEPQNQDLVKEVQLVTEAASVVAYIGLRTAIQAAIRKHYYGDPTAFTALAGGPQPLRADGLNGDGSDSRSAPGLRMESEVRTGISRPSTQISGPTGLRDALGAVRGGAMGDNDFVETLNVFVSLLEMSRNELRGHSAQLARQASTVARRLGLPPRDVTHVAIAAQLHDLGKPADRHYTVAHAAQDPEWKNDAKRYCRAPIKLFEAVHLPVQVNGILAQIYEAYDGTGTPQGARGDDIAAGARILAAVDSYLDLTKNPRNGFQRLLSRDEALAFLNQGAGTLFDPNVVDILARVHSGEFLRQRVVADGRQVLIAEPDEATRIDLLEELGRSSLVTHSVAVLDGVIDALLRGEADLLVIGIRFGAPDVTAIAQYLRGRSETAGVPVVVLGDAPDPTARQRLAQVGVSAVIPLPLDPTAAAATIQALFQEHLENGAPARNVHGSYDEIAPDELFRLFGAGQKSGRLTVRAEGKEGSIHFELGQVIHASFEGSSAEAAVRALAELKTADFVYDPNALLLDMPQFAQPFEHFLRSPAAPAPAATV
jgi:HD-GYP domain-containing protein (c-di-GMP phosphodiesterase class II)